MKKWFYISSVLVLTLLFLGGCIPSSTTEEKAPYEATLELWVVEFSGGGRVENADIKIIDSEGNVLIETKSSNKNDYTTIKIPMYEEIEYVDVVAMRTGHGISKIPGLKLEDGTIVKEEMVLKEAELNEVNTSLSELPELNIEFTTLEGTPINIYEETIKDDFLVKVSYSQTKWDLQFVYSPLFNRVPKAGFLTPEREISYNEEVTFEVNINAADNGENKLYLVVYDDNANRTQYVFYINILKDEVEIQPEDMYSPILMSDEGFNNIYSFTRRSGVAFYGGLPAPNHGNKEIRLENNLNLEQAISHDKIGDKAPYSAPKGANLFVQLYWLDYDSAASIFGLVDSEIRPDGYNVYRSFDGENYEKIGYVDSDLASYKAYYNYNYMLLDYPLRYYLPLIVDASAELEAGKETWYAVSSVYGDKESDKVDLGSVVPLDAFNVILENPLDGSTDVSRAPVFKWSPDNILTSTEGTVTYNYNMFIYDRTHADNSLIAPFSDISVELNGFLFSSETPDQIVAPFTGNEIEENWGYKWYYFDEYGLNAMPYDYEKLQPNKTYAWGVNVAYAEVIDEDSVSLSIAADFRLRDYGWIIDPYPYGMEPDLHADFTTGH